MLLESYLTVFITLGIIVAYGLWIARAGRKKHDKKL